MGADLRTIVLRLLHAALAWFLPHARALYTRLENLARHADSTVEREPRVELDLALSALIDKTETRLRSRVATTVALARSLLARLASQVLDRVSRAEALLRDRAVLDRAAKASRLAQARVEITSRAALGRARKVARRLPIERLETLGRTALRLCLTRLRAAAGSPAARRAGLAALLAWCASNFSASRREAALRFWAVCRAAFASRLAAARRVGVTGFRTKVGPALTVVFALATRVAAAVWSRIAAARRSAAQRRESRLRAEGEAALAAAEIAHREARLRTIADGVMAAEGESAVALGENVPPRVSVAGNAVVDEAVAIAQDITPRAALAEDGRLVGLAALLTDEPAEPVRVREVPGQRRSRGRVPDGVRVAIGAVMVLVVTAGIGLWSSSLGDDAEKTKQAQPTAAAPAAAPTPSAAMVEAGGPVEAVPKIVPLSQRNPITGPNRPPMPDDEAGPYGSRRTTGTYEVALTFDDGPDPRYTPEVLALLRQYRIKATFCVIGVNVVEFPELVRAIAAEGHTLCNHSWVHDTGLGSRSFASITADLARTTEAIKAAAPGSRVSYFRHPGGAWTQAAVNSARQQGMTSLHWDVDPRDWLTPGPRTISSFVTASTQPGSIVLLHDGGGDRLGTVEALSSILPNLVSRLRLVALPPGIDPPRLHGIHLPIHAGQQ